MKKMMLILIALVLIGNISALRITPAINELNFKPGLEAEITYVVDNILNRTLEIFSDGDLAEYVTFDKDKLLESGAFTAYIKLPDEIEIPGKKRTYIGIREIVPDAELKGGVATAVTIKAVLVVYVPYPGQYLETSVTAHDVNSKEPINFTLNIDNKGKEDVIIKPRIEIYSEEDELLGTLDFQEREIKTAERVELEKILDTSEYNPGRYYAKSVVDYAEKTAIANASFRIGELNINIVNHSSVVLLNGTTARFDIDLESSWNSIIDGAYAEVLIFNQTNNYAQFKTFPTSLNPWERKTIYGYFETSGLAPGNYKADINVFFYGKDIGKSTNKVVDVKLIEVETINYYLILIVALSVILFLLIAFLIFKSFFNIKHGKRK